MGKRNKKSTMRDVTINALVDFTIGLSLLIIEKIIR